jgi:hypothetical protein
MVFLPPQNIALRDRSKKSIFLAGSIEMGLAEDWQQQLGDWLIDKNYNVFNPRRADWDSSWIQTYEDPNFSQQVKWEMNALEKADYIIMYLDPQTKSPISLLELGLHAASKKLFVVCPDGFWRKGNVEVVCSLYDIPLFNNLEELKTCYLFNI